MERRRPSLIGPLILITIGVLFLLANMGTLPYSFWEIALRFWPVILILVGLDIVIGRQSAIGALLIVVLWIALVGGAIWLATTQGGGLLPSPPAVTEQLSQPLGDVESATVNLDGGIADMSVTALGSDSSDLMTGSFGHPEGVRMVKSYNVAGKEGRLTVRGEGTASLFFTFRNSRWDIRLNPEIPLALDVNGGIGRATLDLAGLQLTRLSLNAGLGSVEVTTPRTGIVTMRLDGGIGSTTVTIPQGVAARIRVDEGLSRTLVDDSRFPRVGNSYQSADYATAPNKIDIDINGGIGSIRIR